MLSQGVAVAVEKPDYSIVEKAGDMEIRDYPPLVLAEITVDGSLGDAASKAFRPLANYIFDEERSAGKIDMTAPVIQQREKIAMTAPVTQQQDDSGRWTIAFIMPGEWTLEGLPAPKNPDIELRREPARRMAAIQFSWFATPGRLKAQEEELRAWLEKRALKPAGSAIYAYYDPPFQLPFLRRNEVLIPIEAKSAAGAKAGG